MERITLDEARTAGLDVAADGDELVVRGPRHAEPLARRVLANKPEIMAELAARRLPAPVPNPTDGVRKQLLKAMPSQARWLAWAAKLVAETGQTGVVQVERIAGLLQRAAPPEEIEKELKSRQ